MFAAVRQTLRSGEFWRSSATSALATASDYVVAALLAASGVAAGSATFIGCACGGVVAFSVNRGWAFRSQGQPAREVFKFSFVWALNAILNAVGVRIATASGLSFGQGWMLVRGAVYLGWNYPMLRFFVFPPARAPSADAEPPVAETELTTAERRTPARR